MTTRLATGRVHQGAAAHRAGLDRAAARRSGGGPCRVLRGAPRGAALGRRPEGHHPGGSRESQGRRRAGAGRRVGSGHTRRRAAEAAQRGCRAHGRQLGRGRTDAPRRDRRRCVAVGGLRAARTRLRQPGEGRRRRATVRGDRAPIAIRRGECEDDDRDAAGGEKGSARRRGPRTSRRSRAIPSAGVAANNLAWIYASEGKLDQALRLATTAKAALRRRPEAEDTLGWIYLQKGLASQAIAAFEWARDRAPKNPVYHYHLGLAHVKSGDPSRARTSFARALQLQPEFRRRRRCAGAAGRGVGAVAVAMSRTAGLATPPELQRLGEVLDGDRF